MGSRFDAFQAGQKPKKTPTAAENPTARKTEFIDTTALNAKNDDAIDEIPVPIAMPIRPPKIDKTTASVKNCIRTFEGLAPIAILMPISRVRSLTDTNMIFIMPMPPTINEIEAIEPNKRLITLAMFAAFSKVCVKSRI